MLPSSTDQGTAMPRGRGSVMLPYLPAFCNFYLHHRGRRWRCLVAPPAPPQVPSCLVRPQRLRMPDATTTARAVRRASARCGASPPAWQQAPTRWCSPGCWPAWYPLLLASTSWWRLSVCQRTPLRETRGYGSRRSPLVPWGEIPLYLGEKSPCTLGRNPLVPWGEIPLYFLAKWPWTLGRSPLVPWGEIA
jgi:hypothetical protein